MKDWLQKILTPRVPLAPDSRPSSTSVPVVKPNDSLPAQPLARKTTPQPTDLPNATVIYGIGASFLFVAAFFTLVNGRWFTALGIFALGMCLVGFALHLLKHRD